MKKNSMSSRALALLLALVMVLSVVPAGVFAANIGDLYAGDTGIKNNTLGSEDPINWPVKIYDYLDDGILFECAQANIKDAAVASQDSYYNGIKYLYGGGKNQAYVDEGSDFTGTAWFGDKAPWKTVGFTNNFTATMVTPTDYVKATATTDDDSFVNPRFLRITKNSSSYSSAFCLKNFVTTTSVRSTAYIKLSSIRYMVLVYKASGFSDETDLTIWLEKSSGYSKPSVKIEDSSKWTAKIIDIAAIMGSSWSTYSSSNITALYLNMPSLDSTDKLDISHVAFFDSEFEAKQFAIDAEAFSNNPGELLTLAKNITTTTVNKTTLPKVEKPDYILSANYRYYSTTSGTAGYDKITASDPGTYYGLDLTSKTTTNGAYTTGYSTDSYNSWKAATNVTMAYGSASSTKNYPMNQMTVTEMTEDQGQKYVRLTNGGGNTGRNRIVLTKFWEEKAADSSAPKTKDVNYLVLVYRTNGLTNTNKYGFWAQGNTGGDTPTYYIAGLADAANWTSAGATNALNFKVSEDQWTYMIVDLTTTIGAKDTDMGYFGKNSSKGELRRVGMYLPPLVSGKSLDLAYVAYFPNTTVADYFGANASAYMNGGKTVTSTTGNTVSLSGRNWSGGNNLAFGLLYSSQGGGWSNGIYGGSSTNTSTGYDTWRIGYDMLNGYSFSSNSTRQDVYGNSFTAYYTAASSSTAATPSAGSTSNNIFYLTSAADDGDSSNDGFDMSKLDLDGYQLLTTLTQGGMTAGMLEGTLEDGRPVYRQEAVEYVAMVLYRALTIPQIDADGDYNYNYITGSPSTIFGGFDLNGDGKIGMADLNGDNYAETNEASVDLATALRGCLGIRFTLGQQRGTNPALGSYKQTAKKNLVGEFKSVRNNITTCMDAAYFLLNSLFYANSYNQLQNDYRYLRLEHATMDNGKTAYVFDAGYSTGNKYTEGTTIGNDPAYEASSQSAIVYDPRVTVNADGTITKGEGAIYMENVNSKDKFFFLSSYTTTRFPFLPVTDAEGDFAGATNSYYFYDDGVTSLTPDKGTYADRNFNYTMACNGEFVYHEEDGLFFEFEGDDDVYLFINDQIVLDLGGAHSISNESFEVNKYVEWAREIVAAVDAKNGDYAAAGYTKDQYDRALALDLVEGEICRFDFYYMERHGYGANCRIVTNMIITDPALHTEKTASQTIDEVREDIPYGGVVDYEYPVAYYFKLTNSGNTKLYNLTFEDKDIGVKLDYTNGLTVDEDINGYFVMDSTNGTLEASDLIADVVGYERVGSGGTHNKRGPGDYVEAENGEYRYAEVKGITFKDNQALIKFLALLDAEGTVSGDVDAELTQNGAGLWVDGYVKISGIHFLMNDNQVTKGYFDNTVHVTATSRSNPNDPDSEDLTSSANHRIYISGDPVYYQWANHELYLTEKMILDDATKAAGNGTGGQLSQYADFFNAAGNDTSKIFTILADKNGALMDYGDLVKWESSKEGLLVNFTEPGTQIFYLYMYLKDDTYNGEAGIQKGEFAIVRVTVNVADVKDSTYVLDYGLKTENLDAYGELFKNDELLGGTTGILSKLMAVSNSAPSYLNYTSNKTNYNRINFTPYIFDTNDTYRIWTYGKDNAHDGFFTMNLEIPSDGREISYNANTGGYSLTDVGTVTIHANVPFAWDSVYLYWWYDNNVSNAAFPGQQMTRSRAGKFSLDIPADVPHVIISRPVTDAEGNVTYDQTSDLNLSMGNEAWIELSGKKNISGKLAADVFYSMATTTMHAIVPEGWGDVYLYYWNETGVEGEDYPAWPGAKMTDPEGDGTFSLSEIPGNITNVIVNDGQARSTGKQTNTLGVYAGREATITVKTSYQAAVTVTPAETKETFTVHAKAPESWGSNIYLYYWDASGNNFNNGWPGPLLTEKDEEGFYILDIPNTAANVIINNGSGTQTNDLAVESGREVWVTANEDRTGTKEYRDEVPVTVTVPADWGNIYLYYFNENGVEGEDYPAWPGTLLTAETGEYAMMVPGGMTGIIINDGSARDEGKQTTQINVTAGGTLAIAVSENCPTVANVNSTPTTAESYTVTVTVDESWGEDINLHYWTDGGDSTAWPGEPMTKNEDGTFTLTIPSSFNKVIVNNGTVQTGDLSVIAGKDVNLTVDANGGVAFEYQGTYTVNVTVPASWGSNINLYCFNEDMGLNNGWPGAAMTRNDDGTFTVQVPDYATKVIVNNIADGKGLQTGDLWLGASTGASVDVWEYYEAEVSYTTETVTVHVAVPDSWVTNGESIHLYCWDSNNDKIEEWPGILMTKGEDGWYTAQMPDTFTNVIINNGSKQTINLTVRTGLEPWVMINDATVVEDNNTRYTASVGNGNSAEEEGFFFTPVNFMDTEYNLWMAITVHSTKKSDGTAFGPTALGNSVDVHNEVQLYKKITVLPANVVYYEDDFVGISYDKNTDNSFSYLGGGSGSLKQSVDQDMEYGQDPYYQGAANDYYSGNSLTQIKVNSADAAATFTFSGTGFEVIGRTNATDSGMMKVQVYNAADYAKYKAGALTSIEPYMTVPVINEYDNGADGGKDSIEQVPVVRVTSITKLLKNEDGTYAKDENGKYQYETLGYGTYTVVISGMPIYHFCGAKINGQVVQAATCVTGGTAVSTCSGCGETWNYTLPASGHNYLDGKCQSCGQSAPCVHSYENGACKTCGVSETCKHNYQLTATQTAPSCVDCGVGTYTCSACGHSYTDVIKPTGHSYTDTAEKKSPAGYTYKALICAKCDDPMVPVGNHYNGITGTEDAYLYIDGVRIFQPYNSGSSDLYRPVESGAAFTEIRNMIVGKQMFVISTSVSESFDSNTNKSTVKISGGMNTWTENRIGMDSDGNSWSGNTVGKVAEYLFAGPNNEVYLAAGQDNPSALAFYVKETIAGEGNVQIAVRGIDNGGFFGNDRTGLNATLMLGVVTEEGNLGWMPLAEVVSGTEQYYTIPYAKCPYDSTNGRYQVVLQVVNSSGTDVTGMVSFSSLKTNGVTIPALSGENYELTYSYDSGSLVDPITGETMDSSEYVNFAMISKQMRSNVLVLDESTGSDNTGSDDTGSEDTGSDDTGSDDTGSDDTGSEDTGSDDTGSEDTGSDDTGSDDTGSNDTGSNDTGSEDTGSNDTGSGDTGSDDTGSNDTGSNEGTPGTGDVSIMGILFVMIAALMAVVMLLPKKLNRA